MKVKVTHEIEIEIDGKTPSQDFMIGAIRDALCDAMPSVMCDSDEEDCILFVQSWETEVEITEK